MKDQSKVKPYKVLGPSHPHLIHSPQDAAPNCFTCTMKDKIKFHLHYEGQDIKLIHHRRSEYKHITQDSKE
jgi:hypothetical protein